MRFSLFVLPLLLLIAACELRNPTAPFVPTLTPRVMKKLPDTLISTSGLIYWKDEFWSHGDIYSDKIFCLDSTGKQLKSIRVKGGQSPFANWEDMAQDKKYIYIANTGNNLNGARQDLCIYRIAKKDLLKANVDTVDVDTIQFSYADQKDLKPHGNEDTDFDCEAMMVYGDSLYLFTKQWLHKGTAAYSLPKKPGIYKAKRTGAFEFDGLVTGAAALPSRGIVALCGYTTNKATYMNPFVLLLHGYKGTQFFSGQKNRLEIDAPFHQVEAITLTPDGRCFITNEGIDKFAIDITPKLMEIRLPRKTVAE